MSTYLSRVRQQTPVPPRAEARGWRPAFWTWSPGGPADLGGRNTRRSMCGRPRLWIRPKARLIAGRNLEDQAKNAFNVKSLRKKINQICPFNPVPQTHKGSQIPRQGGWIAGDIGDARCTQLRQIADIALAQPSAWGIGYNQVGSLRCALQILFRGGPDCLYLLRRIVAQIGIGSL